MKTIGMSFADELKAQGLLGLPFSWGSDGAITYGDEITEEERTRIEAVLAAHDPDAVPVGDKLAKLNAECEAQLGAIRDKYPLSEILSWPKQEAEARAVAKDPAAPAPLLSTMAQIRGITVADLATRVLAKADAYTALVAQAVGTRQKLEDQIEAAASINV